MADNPMFPALSSATIAEAPCYFHIPVDPHNEGWDAQSTLHESDVYKHLGISTPRMNGMFVVITKRDWCEMVDDERGHSLSHRGLECFVFYDGRWWQAETYEIFKQWPESTCADVFKDIPLRGSERRILLKEILRCVKEAKNPSECDVPEFGIHYYAKRLNQEYGLSIGQSYSWAYQWLTYQTIGTTSDRKWNLKPEEQHEICAAYDSKEDNDDNT
jgi:hypothetical protein